MVTQTKKTPNGVLPSKKWLIENGKGNLVKAMLDNPERFAHVVQDNDPEDDAIVQKYLQTQIGA
jgi:hypothetical protein